MDQQSLYAKFEVGSLHECAYLLGFEHYVDWELDYLPPAEVQPVEPIYSGPSAIEREKELEGTRCTSGDTLYLYV